MTHYDYYDLITALIRNHSNELDSKPIHYLEIGTQEGGSAVAAHKSGCIGLAVLVDTWGDKYGGSARGTPQHVVKALGAEMGNTIILTGDSKTVIPAITHTFDFIFVDGDHSEAGCWVDMQNCLPLLATNGVMLVDDVDHPAHAYLGAAVDRFALENKLSVRYHTLHYGQAELRRM